MKYKMTLFIAYKSINSFMRSVDLREEGKWYFSDTHVWYFSTDEQITQEFFLRIIEKSKSIGDWWIPAIKFCDFLYSDPSVRELSNGKEKIFIPEG